MTVVDDPVWAPTAPVHSAPAGRSTVLPGRRRAGGPPPQPRPLRGVSREAALAFGGSAVSALSVTLLLFGRLTPLSGKVGFVAVALFVFVLTYAVVVRLTDDVPAVVDRVMTVLMTTGAALASSALIWVVTSTIWKGRRALWNFNLFTQDMGKAGPLEPLSEGGVLHAIVGTLIVIGISLAITVPLGIACAVYLNESGSRPAGLVRAVVTAMTALPSIVAGLFVFAVWVLTFGWPRGGMAAALAVSLMMLPIIIRSADVVLRLVPGNLREASAALGAPQWRTVWHVVLPTARSGLSTAVILGVARGVGETAPVLLTSGVGQTLNTDPFHNPMMSLPLATYQFVRSPQATQVARGFATATVLMIVVLLLFSLARFLGGRPAGRLSKRQARRALTRSARDLTRIEGHHS